MQLTTLKEPILTLAGDKGGTGEGVELGDRLAITIERDIPK